MNNNCRENKDLVSGAQQNGLEDQVVASSCRRQCNQNCQQRPPMQQFRSTSYASYNISTSAVANTAFLPLTTTFTGTTNYNLSSGNTVILPAGCVYKVEYIIQAVLPDIGFITVVPVINNVLQTNLSSTVNSYTGGTGTFSVSGGFLIEATQATTLALEFLTDQATTGAVTGTLSIVAVSDIVTYCNPLPLL